MIKKVALFLLALTGLGVSQLHAFNIGSYYYSATKVSTTTKLSEMALVGDFYFLASTNSTTVMGVVGSTRGIDFGMIQSTDTVVRRNLTVGGTANLAALVLPGNVDVAGKLAELSDATSTIVNTLSTGSISNINTALASLVISTTGFKNSINSLNAATGTIRSDVANLMNSTGTISARVAVLEANPGSSGNGSLVTNINGALVSVSTIVPGGNIEFTMINSSLQIKVNLTTANVAIANLNLSTAALTTRANNLDSSTGTLTQAVNSSAAFVTTALINLANSTSTLTQAINSSAAVTTTRFNNVAIATAAQQALIQASAAFVTTSLNSVAASTANQLSLLQATAAADTSAFNALAASTSTLTQAINSSAALVTAALNSIRISTNNLSLIAINTNFILINGTQTISGQPTYSNAVTFSSGIILPDGTFISSAAAFGTANVNTGSTNTWTAQQNYARALNVSSSIVVSGDGLFRTTTTTDALTLRKLNVLNNFMMFDSSQTSASQGIEIANSSVPISRFYYNGNRSPTPGWVLEQPVGTERLVISSGTGYMGIGGVPSPTNMLSVLGGAYFSSSVTVANLYSLGAAGIGTTSPGATLDVIRSAGSAGIIVRFSSGTQNYGEVTTSSVSFTVPVTVPSMTVTTTLVASAFLGDCSSCTRLNPINLLNGALPVGVRASSTTAQTVGTTAIKSTNRESAGFFPQSNGDDTITWVAPGAVNNSLSVSTINVTSSATLRDSSGNGLIGTKDIRSTNWTSTTSGYLVIGSTTPGDPRFTYAVPDCDQNGNCNQPFNFQAQVTISTELVIGSGYRLRFAGDNSTLTSATGFTASGWTLSGSSTSTSNHVQIGTNTESNSVLTVQSTPGVNVAELRTYSSTSATMVPEFVSYKWVQGSTVTASNSTGTVLSVSVPTSSVIYLDAKVTGFRILGPSGFDGDAAAYSLRQGFSRIGTAAPVPLGNVQADIFEASATWNASFSTTSSGVNVNVLAGTGTMTTKWSATVGLQVLSTATFAVASGGGAGGSSPLVIDTVTFSDTNNTSGLTFAHHVSDTAVNPCIAVFAGIRGNSGQSITGVTYNGVNVPFALSSTGSNSSLYTWFLPNASTGIHNIVVTADNATPQLTAMAVSFDHCTATGNVTSNIDDTTSATSISTTSVSALAEIGIEGTIIGQLEQITPTVGQASLSSMIGTNFAMEISSKTGAASLTMGSSWTTGSRVKQVLMPVK